MARASPTRSPRLHGLAGMFSCEDSNMDDEQDVLDLGDAKMETNGWGTEFPREDHPLFPWRED